MIKKMEHTRPFIVGDMDETIHYYSDMFGFKFALKALPKKERWLFCILKNSRELEIELIRDIDPIGKYNKSGIVNHLAFTVEDINKAIQHYEEQRN